MVSPGPRGSPEIGLVETQVSRSRLPLPLTKSICVCHMVSYEVTAPFYPGPGCSPSCSAARNSINSAPSSAARSSAMRFLAMCPTTASPS